MKISGLAVIPSLLVVMLLFSSSPSLAETVYLFGKIGDFPVGAALERDEGNISGWYFYQSKAREIRLEGAIGRDGALRMEESAGNKKTGIFEGTVKEGRWAGTWRKGTGAPRLAFTFQENRNQLKDLKGRYDCSARERDGAHHYTYRWNIRFAVADGVVKKLASTQGSYGDDKDEQTCSIDLTDLKQVPSEAGILLEAGHDGSNGEGGRCTVRIVGDGKILWIRFGDSSEDGNDCRNVGSNMFCSPRAFWNDLILDRRTQKCKALK